MSVFKRERDLQGKGDLDMKEGAEEVSSMASLGIWAFPAYVTMFPRRRETQQD